MTMVYSGNCPLATGPRLLVFLTVCLTCLAPLHASSPSFKSEAKSLASTLKFRSEAKSHASTLDSKSEAKSFVQELFDKIASTQIKKDVPYEEFFEWHKAKGVFQSEVRLNFYGNPVYSEFRKEASIFDNNMFATAWVVTNLLEAYKYGAAPIPTDEQLELALEAIGGHYDHNAGYNTSNVLFWPQFYNKTVDYWRTTPDNMLSLFEDVNALPFGTLEEILTFFGFGDIAEEIQELLDSEDMYLQAFRVPPDLDDTYVNLGLGAMLHNLKSDLPDAWNLWSANNRNLTSVIDGLKTHPYRPFSDDFDASSIDSRTYFYLRHFLDDAASKKQDVALVPTWIQSIKDIRTTFSYGNVMPFNINNVDLTVAADVVFGLTSSVLSGLLSPHVLEDPEIAQIYVNTSFLMAFEIASNLSSRPDLALTYYPSAIEYYWFVTKTVSILETAYRQTGSFPTPVMEDVYNILKEACQGPMTEVILAQAQYEKQEKYYFDDFLGNGDTDFFGKPTQSHEDRLFTTAMASNALLYTWTVFDEDAGISHWRDDTPSKVREVIDGTIYWLTEYTLSGKYKPWNAFFSGSVKGYLALPFWYPANLFQWLNGTDITDWTVVPTDPFIYGVQGYIPKEEYEKQINESHFGIPTPVDFDGYNTNEDYFPFWSSDSYTYSSILLAVARFENTMG